MKVLKLISIPDQEIEVDVSAEEIAGAIAEDPEREHTCTRGISNALRFLIAVPDAMIEQFNAEKRKVILFRLLEQAERYKQKGTPT